MTDEQRERFDQLLEDVIATLPEHYASLLHEVSLVVLDRPTPEMVKQLRIDGLIPPEGWVDPGDDPDHPWAGAALDGSDLCGLHTGTALTERSVQDSAVLPDQIHLFRDGIASLALEGYEPVLTWESPDAEEALYEEIRTTLLHEMGHHFGLDEGDLDELGYG